MKRDKPDRKLEEMFRDKFLDYEVFPDKGFWPRFEKKLKLKEFLRFNPGKFNIFYLGALVAGVTAISLAVLLKEETTVTGDYAPPEISDQVANSVSLEEITPLGKERPEKGSAGASAKVSTITTREAELKDQAKEEVQRINQRVKSLEFDSNDKERQLIAEDSKSSLSDMLIKPAPAAGFDVDNLSGCVPLTVSFRNLSHSYDSCMWEFGDGGYSTAKDPVWIFDEDGEYHVRLLVFGSDNRVARSETIIRVHPLPVASFEISNGDPVLPDEQVLFYNYSENSVKWRWDFGDGETSFDYEPSHSYNKSGSYSVKLLAVSEHGCVDSLVITNAFGANTCFLKFPNAFIPNDGGPTGGYYSNRTDIQSEVFHPVWSGVTDYNLRIFTRTGLLIFETNDINIGWDGYYKGQKADPGVYIWKVRGAFKNGDPFVKGGDITLLPRR